MDVAYPHTAVSPSLEGEVLVTLAGTTRPLTGREVARLVRWGSQAGVSRALQRLTAHGIISEQQAGRALLFTLNREHVAAPIVEALRDLRGEVIRRVRRAMSGWKVKAAHGSLFGSMARADGDTESDIDLFLVRPRSTDAEDDRWRRQVDALSTSVHAWTGNRLGVSEVAESEARELRKRRPAILADLKRDAVHLVGWPTAALFGGR